LWFETRRIDPQRRFEGFGSGNVRVGGWAFNLCIKVGFSQPAQKSIEMGLIEPVFHWRFRKSWKWVRYNRRELS
jgi:hypothetical protein